MHAHALSFNPLRYLLLSQLSPVDRVINLSSHASTMFKKLFAFTKSTTRAKPVKINAPAAKTISNEDGDVHVKIMFDEEGNEVSLMCASHCRLPSPSTDHAGGRTPQATRGVARAVRGDDSRRHTAFLGGRPSHHRGG